MGLLDKLQRRFANKSRKYWEYMRSTLNLMERSEHIDDLVIEHARSELQDILDSGILSYPQTLRECGLEPDMSYKERRAELGFSLKSFVRSSAEERFLKDMAHKAQTSRKSNWTWRIGEEAEEKHKLGWYPFFVTLTVDPQLTDPKELWQKGREFRKYIRKLANVVCKELGHPQVQKPPYRPESDYVTYAGVIEHGKSREHHHGHFIIWLRAIPSSWRICPNAGIANPAKRTRNECKPMRSLWQWSLPGLSPALYFRSISDVWEHKHNFILPIGKDGKPMKVSKPRVAGAYITKYLTKEFKEWRHRMKATRNLGMTRLKKVINSLDQSVVEALTWRPENSVTNHTLMTTHMVPLGLLRSEAKHQNYLMKFKQNQLGLRELLSSNTKIFTEMLWSVRNGARPERMDSSDFFDWVGNYLPAQRGYSRSSLIIAHTYLATHFPIEKDRINHTKIGANDIGYS